MMKEVLDFLNSKIREEHGNRVSIDDMWTKAEVDSFGTIMVFTDMHDKYGCFDSKWFLSMSSSEVKELTIRDIVERIL